MHDCRVPIVFCLFLVVCVQCLLRIVPLTTQHPVGFDECVAAAVENLSIGLPLASFGCSKCGATHLDANKFATKLYMRHVCSVCNHCWIKLPAVVGNPLAALGCSLDKVVLSVSRVPVTAGEPHVVSGQT